MLGHGPWLTVGEALSEPMRWSHSVRVMVNRTLDPDGGDYTREGDVRLFAVAVRQVLRFAALTYELAGPDQRPAIRGASATSTQASRQPRPSETS